MHVGLNLAFLVPGETGGMETYARRLIPALAEADPELRLTLFVAREAAAGPGFEPGDRLSTVTLPARTANRLQWVRAEQLSLPRRARRAGVDLVHSLASTAPLRGSFRRVVTVHDLIHRSHPEAHSGVLHLGMRTLVPLGIRRAHRVIAVSRATRDELIRELGVPAGKIDVVPHGAPDPPGDPAGFDKGVLRREGLGNRRLVLSAGGRRAHKNLDTLVDALARIPENRRPDLVLAGYPAPGDDALRARAAALGVARQVRIPGWLPPAELEALYAAADLCVVPSLAEGFGLPVLEAMVRGVPVACSDRGSLPEVAGDAARLFDPADPAAIAATIQSILADSVEATRLSAAGRERAARFTWEAAARATLDVYRRALE